MVTTEKAKDGKCYLEFLGEDCPDEIIISNRAYFDPATKKVLNVEKVVMKEKFDDNWNPKYEVLKTIPIVLP